MPKQRRWSIAIMLPLLLTLGCSGSHADRAAEEETLSWSVANGGGVAPDSVYRLDDAELRVLPTVQPELQVTLGNGARGEKDFFGAIGGLAVDAGRRIYVWDSMLLRISVFDNVGNFVRNIGRAGDGPGEFSSPRGETNLNSGNGITISHDTVLVIDRSIAAFDTSGRYLGASPREMNVWNAKRLTATPNGVLITEDQIEDGVSLKHQFLTYGLGHARDGFSVSEKLFVSSADKNSLGPRVPLPLLPFAQSENGLIYLVVADSFQINAVDLDGRVHRTYVARPARRAVTEADVQAQWASIEHHYRETRARQSKASLGSKITIIRRGFDARPRAKFRESINALIVSADGDLLLRRTDTAEHPYNWSDSSPAEWVLVTASGRGAVRLQLPGSFMPKVFSDCIIYGINQDRDGQDLVQRYRLPPASCE